MATLSKARHRCAACGKGGKFKQRHCPRCRQHRLTALHTHDPSFAQSASTASATVTPPTARQAKATPATVVATTPLTLDL